MFLKILFDNFSKLSDQLKHTNFQKRVEEGIVSLKEGDDQIFSKEVVKSFLFDSTLSNLFRKKLIV